MTIVKGKAKQSFWIGLTSKEAISAREIALRPVSVPWVFRVCLCPFLSCLKALPFCLLCWVFLDACNLPSQCCGTALPTSHRGG